MLLTIYCLSDLGTNWANLTGFFIIFLRTYTITGKPLSNKVAKYKKKLLNRKCVI